MKRLLVIFAKRLPQICTINASGICSKRVWLTNRNHNLGTEHFIKNRVQTQIKLRGLTFSSDKSWKGTRQTCETIRGGPPKKSKMPLFSWAVWAQNDCLQCMIFQIHCQHHNGATATAKWQPSPIFWQRRCSQFFASLTVTPQTRANFPGRFRGIVDCPLM